MPISSYNGSKKEILEYGLFRKSIIPSLKKDELIIEINNYIDTSKTEFDNLLTDFYNSPNQ